MSTPIWALGIASSCPPSPSIRAGRSRAESLADALWGERPPASWAKVVQGCVVRLRRTLGPNAIVTVSGGYRLALVGDDLDTTQFERLVERGRTQAATGEPEQAAATFERALLLWRGAPFADLDGWAPGRSEAVRLQELRRTAEEELLEARLAAGEHRAVVAEAEVRVAEEPLREHRWAILALAQWRSGLQGDALRSLHEARRTLADELGIEPGPELVALEAAILRQDPALAPGADAIPTATECPYKGLAPYEAGDADAFFGRDDEIAACLRRLDASPLLVVAGPSGCGKSSLVRAGVVPALAAGRAGRRRVRPRLRSDGRPRPAPSPAPGTARCSSSTSSRRPSPSARPRPDATSAPASPPTPPTWRR